MNQILNKAVARKWERSLTNVNPIPALATEPSPYPVTGYCREETCEAGSKWDGVPICACKPAPRFELPYSRPRLLRPGGFAGGRGGSGGRGGFGDGGGGGRAGGGGGGTAGYR